MTILGVTASSIAKAPPSFDSIASATGNQATYTFSSIPQTYKALRIHILVQSSSAQSAFFRINGDTTATYSLGESANKGGTTSLGQGYITPQAQLYFPSQYGFSQQANQPYVAIIDINDYASTSRIKVGKGYGGIMAGAANSIGVGYSIYRWNSTAAITSLSFSVSGTNSAATSFALYGVK